MRHARMVAVLAVIVLVSGVVGCSKKPDAYPTDLVNDGSTEVVVTGCPDCGDGRSVAAGQTLRMKLPAGQTDLVVSSNGEQLGCSHAVNDVSPESGDPARVLTLSSIGSCELE